MVLHLTDFDKRLPMCEPMCLWAQSVLPGCVFRGVLGSVGHKGTPRPMWVFQKRQQCGNSKREEDKTDEVLAKHFPHVYGKLKNM
jgi:hypothetical protein